MPVALDKRRGLLRKIVAALGRKNLRKDLARGQKQRMKSLRPIISLNLRVDLLTLPTRALTWRVVLGPFRLCNPPVHRPALPPTSVKLLRSCVLESTSLAVGQTVTLLRPLIECRDSMLKS